MVAITIRDIPDEVRDELAGRAARAGQSLQEYLRGLLVATAAKPTVHDVIARARTREYHRCPSGRGDDPRCQRRRPPVTDRIVCDASAVVAALLDSGSNGQWAASQMADVDLYAPTPLPYECANIIRRQELGRTISADQAAQAHVDLLDLAVDLWPYEVLSTRTWALRTNLSSYDAAYIALAEILAAPLVTLDQRIRRAPGITCVVSVPDADRR